MTQENMSEMLDGKQIKAFSWVEPEIGNLTVNENQEAIFHYEYYGDHSENWIILKENGKEIHRYNTRYLDSILWK